MAIGPLKERHEKLEKEAEETSSKVKGIMEEVEELKKQLKMNVQNSISR